MKIHPVTENCWNRYVVTGRDPVILRFGPGCWLSVVHVSITLAGAAAVLLSPAGWHWKTGTLLILVWVSAWLYWLSTRPGQRGTLRLLPDGTAEIRPERGGAVIGTLEGNAWASRWLCVVSLRDRESRKLHYCVVSASANPRDAYRRFLVILRMGSFPTIAQTNSWI